MLVFGSAGFLRTTCAPTRTIGTNRKNGMAGVCAIGPVGFSPAWFTAANRRGPSHRHALVRGIARHFAATLAGLYAALSAWLCGSRGRAASSLLLASSSQCEPIVPLAARHSCRLGMLLLCCTVLPKYFPVSSRVYFSAFPSQSLQLSVGTLCSQMTALTKKGTMRLGAPSRSAMEMFLV